MLSSVQAKIASSALVAVTPITRIPHSRTPLRRGGNRTRAALTIAMVAYVTRVVNRPGPMTDNLQRSDAVELGRARQQRGAERHRGAGRDAEVERQHEPGDARERRRRGGHGE